MKTQYSDSIKEIAGITEEDAREIGMMSGIIANASPDGLKLLQIQIKIYLRYIEKRLNDKSNSNITTKNTNNKNKIISNRR